MRVYTVYIDPGATAPDRGAVLVPEKFAWLAFIAPPLWALWHRMWFWAVGWFALAVLVGAAVEAGAVSGSWTMIGQTGLAVLFGFFANDLRAQGLVARGFVLTDIVAARTLAAAEWRHFSRAAPVAGPAMRSPPDGPWSRSARPGIGSAGIGSAGIGSAGIGSADIGQAPGV